MVTSPSPERRLYHFRMSPFSRRARLCLAHKGLAVELLDARENAALREEAQRLVPIKTIPVLVDGGVALGDSGAISHYLDRAYPAGPALWPADRNAAHRSLEVASLVDVALNAIIDLGTRYWPLHGDPAWVQVGAEMVGRAQVALDALPLAASRLSPSFDAGHMWLFTMVTWAEGLPVRAATNPMIAQVVSLGWTLPEALSRWADTHRARVDAILLDT